MKILIVEDHPLQRKLVAHVLRAGGNEVSTAACAQEAFQAIDDGRPELILLDLGLPEEDGLDIAARIKSRSATAEIAVVGTTSYPELYSRRAAMEAGCDHYLLKPLNTRELSLQLIALSENPSKP